MAMTEEERRQARNEASKRWYQAHKAAKAAMNKLPKAKTAEVKKPGGAKLEKLVDKFVDRGVKAAETYRGLVKSAAGILSDVYRSGDDKLVAKTVKTFGRQLSLVVEADPSTGWGVVKSGELGESKFRVPKAKPAGQEAPSDETGVSPGPEPGEEEDDKIVPVDPSVLTGVGEDEVLKNSDVDSQPGYRDDDLDEDDEDFDDDDDDYDEDEDDEGYDEDRAERRRRREEDDWAEGHDDMMREMSEQGAFDDYEN